ncbi:MAG: tetratricopeptide repeat protein [Vicinamibacterales bacterium]
MAELPFDAPTHLPLRGERIVFAGKPWSLTRKDARAMAERLGGACDDEVSEQTSMVVLGAETFPDGVPADDGRVADTSAPGQRLRRAAEINLATPGRIRLVTEADFCRLVGLPDLQDLRTQHYGQRDILAMYPLLREDHLRYLQKWGLVKPVFRTSADTWYGFADLTTLRQIHTALQQGGAFRAVLRDLQAARSGQLAFDFRLDAHQARIIELRVRRRMADSRDTAAQMARRREMEQWLSSPTADVPPPVPSGDRTLTTAERFFLAGSLLDDGTPEKMQEAAQSYRRALAHDPDLVAAIINLANIHYAMDALAEAQALYERAIGLDPTYFEAYFNLGNIHHDHARYLDAEACYREALGLNGTYPDAHFYLAVTLEKMGRSADARTHWQAYQRLAPQGEWIELAKEFSD